MGRRISYTIWGSLKSSNDWLEWYEDVKVFFHSLKYDLTHFGITGDMIKRYFFLLVIFCILTSAFTESNDTRQVITTDECCNDVFVFDDVKQLEASYWIKELPFSDLRQLIKIHYLLMVQNRLWRMKIRRKKIFLII